METRFYFVSIFWGSDQTEQMDFIYYMAGVLGFEPRMGDSESPALPLGDTPK